jgi:hypothetical protein
LNLASADDIDAGNGNIDTRNIFRCHTSAGDNTCQARDSEPAAVQAFIVAPAAYDSLVLYDAAWHARISRVFSGALGIWGVAGTVGPDPEDANGFVIAPRTGPAICLSHDARAGWAATLRDPASGAEVGLGRHAGLPGLLRRLREELAPDAPAGRLVIGAQQMLGRDGTR